MHVCSHEEHAGFNYMHVLLYWKKIKSPCIIESTAALIDGSSDVQAEKVVLKQAPWQNCTVCLNNSGKSLQLVLMLLICDCKLEMIMNVKF